jgi:phosphatidylserine/phosphatidylglycerophosphate/cardiolipin synthase-like enzyme
VGVIFDGPIRLRKLDKESKCKRVVTHAIQDIINKNKNINNKCSIKIAMYSLDEKDILEKIDEAIKNRVTVEIIMDKQQITENLKKIENKEGVYRYMPEKNITLIKNILTNAKITNVVGSVLNIDVANYSDIITLHEKFSVFSCSNDSSNNVIVGSYNWTHAASTVNYENCLVINDLNAIKSFEDHFNELKVSHKLSFEENNPAVPVNKNKGTYF